MKQAKVLTDKEIKRNLLTHTIGIASVIEHLCLLVITWD